VTHLRCGGNFYTFFRKFCVFPAAKEFWKSVNIWQKWLPKTKCHIFIGHGVHVHCIDVKSLPGYQAIPTNCPMWKRALIEKKNRQLEEDALVWSCNWSQKCFSYIRYSLFYRAKQCKRGIDGWNSVRLKPKSPKRSRLTIFWHLALRSRRSCVDFERLLIFDKLINWRSSCCA